MSVARIQELLELFAPHHAGQMSHQVPEDPEFNTGEGHGLSVQENLVGSEVNDDVADRAD